MSPREARQRFWTWSARRARDAGSVATHDHTARILLDKGDRAAFVRLCGRFTMMADDQLPGSCHGDRALSVSERYTTAWITYLVMIQSSSKAFASFGLNSFKSLYTVVVSARYKAPPL